MVYVRLLIISRMTVRKNGLIKRVPLILARFDPVLAPINCPAAMVPELPCCFEVPSATCGGKLKKKQRWQSNKTSISSN